MSKKSCPFNSMRNWTRLRGHIVQRIQEATDIVLSTFLPDILKLLHPVYSTPMDIRTCTISILELTWIELELGTHVWSFSSMGCFQSELGGGETNFLIFFLLQRGIHNKKFCKNFQIWVA